MKLTVNECLDNKETEIVINCSVMDQRLKQLIRYIRQYTFSLEGMLGDAKHIVPLEEIYYIESVDGRTFLYCGQNVYESGETLAFLEKQLESSTFVRVSKNCILNLSLLESIRSFLNHRIEATMKNGERLMVTRSYLEQFKMRVGEL